MSTTMFVVFVWKVRSADVAPGCTPDAPYGESEVQRVQVVVVREE